MYSQFISIFLSVINLLQKIGFTVKLSSFISKGANILGRPTQKPTGKPSLYTLNYCNHYRTQSDICESNLNN